MLEKFNEELLKKEGKIVVTFKAPWCAPCKALTPILEQLSSEGFSIYTVNTDEDSDMTVKYSVRTVPTTIVFENGKIQKTVTGMLSKSALINLIKE